MNSIAEDIKDILTTPSGSSFTFGQNLFINSMPTQPMDVAVIYETSTGTPDNTLDKKVHWNDSIQILVKASSYVNSQAVCREIIDLLHNRTNEEWNGTKYLFILLQNGPNQLLGTGERQASKGEFLYSINFRIKRNKSNN